MDYKTIQCYCPKCRQNTHHYIIAEKKETAGPEDDFFWCCYYRLVNCCGCDSVSFDIETEEESNVRYDEYGNPEYYTVHTSYPEKEGSQIPIRFSFGFPSNVYNIYLETVKAINNRCLILAAAGFRAVIESICLDKKVGGKTLEQKINNMQKTGIITMADRDRFHSVRFLGNDSIHEMKSPDYYALKIVLEIVEGILTNLYVYDEKLSAVLEGPIRTFDEFVMLLDNGLLLHSKGDIDVLKNLLPRTRRLISDDISHYEQQLINKINSGEYTNLSLCPPPRVGRRQQYKVESVPSQ